MTSIIIESVHQLSTDQINQIKSSLNAPQADVVVKINPLLIAGLKITHNNKVLDNSIRYQLSQMYDQLIS